MTPRQKLLEAAFGVSACQLEGRTHVPDDGVQAAVVTPNGTVRLEEAAREFTRDTAMITGARFFDIVFDGPPSHESGRFVEVEDEHGKSIHVGGWIDRGNGLWALRIAVKS